SRLLFSSYHAHRDLHSFPTRRSSDLRPIAPTAISTRYRAGSRKSAPGLSWPIVPTGWPIPSIGRELRAKSKINCPTRCTNGSRRSEEHTSELQSQSNLVCRLLLEKKK